MMTFLAAALIPGAAAATIVAWRRRRAGPPVDARILQGIVAATADIFGFGSNALYLWSDETKAFEARALKSDRTGGLQAGSMSWDEYQEFGCRCQGLGTGFLCPEATLTGGHGPELVVPLESVSGDVIGLLALAEPRSGRMPRATVMRHLEFLARQATTALESARVFDALAHRNEELSAASRQLQGLAEMKKNLVANVGHELRTPLTSISAYTEMLKRNIDSLDPGSLEDFLEVIANESDKLSAVINDILELGRMEKQHGVTRPEDTDLTQVVSGMADQWREQAAQVDLDLKVAIAPTGILLPVDPVLMRQLLTHLVGNAIKFTPANGRVRVELRETGTAVRLTVEDSGLGIPPDQLGPIFEGFYQVDGTPTRSHNGQGLGLAICRDIVNHHDGRIWAENRAEGGARFTVLLPRRPRVQQPVDPSTTWEPPFAPGEFMARLLHWVSEAMGVQVATLMVPGEGDEHLVIGGAIGLPPAVAQSTRVRRGVGFAGKVWESGESLLVQDVTLADSHRREVNEPRYSTPSLLCVPLMVDGDVVGVLSVNNRTDGRALDRDDLAFLENLAPALGGLLARHAVWQQELHYFRDVRKALRTSTPVGHLRHETLLAVCREICLASARKIALPADDLGCLAYALQFYDVGLETVPRGVLHQVEPLSAAQLRMVKNHVNEALRILAPLAPDPGVGRLILHHHENFDGSGYPAGLAGEAIPVGARLIRLADSLESMLGDRPGRPALTLAEATDEIEREAGRLFCPHLTTVFLEETVARKARIQALQKRHESVAGLIRQAHAEPAGIA